MNSEILELQITDLSRGGAGVGKDPQGRVVFVPYTAPGDRVRVRVLKDEGRYAQGELIEVLSPGAVRVQAPCEAFGQCGGCQWQHLPYSLQWSTKVSGVRHALQRTQVPAPEHWEELPAERIWEYRNRVQLRAEAGRLGFFAARSHEIIPVRRCEIARPEINASWEETRLQAEQRLNSPDSPSAMCKVEVEVLPDGELRRSWNAPHGAAGFRQVHDEQNEKLQRWVATQITPGRELLDLFGGSGNLSLSLAEKVTQVECVDTGAPAKAPAGTPANFVFHRSPVLLWLLRRLKHQGIRPARPKKGTQLSERSAILDPPREGLGKDGHEIIVALEALGVREVVAVGCDPDSWARDLSKFSKRGWRLERVAILDLFPQTPHVESLGVLRSPDI